MTVTVLWTCAACQAANRPSQRVCELCGADRPRGVPIPDGPAPTKPACGACGEAYPFWTSLTPGEDGVRRCATCHVAHLRRRMEADPASPEVRRAALAQMRRIGSPDALADSQARPSLSELAGWHPIRTVALTWLTAHPTSEEAVAWRKRHGDSGPLLQLVPKVPR